MPLREVHKALYMADPNTMKYSDVEMTGDTMLWNSVRQARASSNR